MIDQILSLAFLMYGLVLVAIVAIFAMYINKF